MNDPIDIRHLKEATTTSPSDMIPLYSSTQGQNRKISVANLGTGGGGGASGYSGKSGYSGFSGANGTSGFSGFSGTNGSAGTSGFSGFSGTNGTIGVSGFSGFSGITGSNGTSGFSGFSGSTGYSGFSGISGYSGFSGRSGYSGFSGFSGFSGATGTGTSGFSGFSGLSGFSGFSGYSGLSGYSGFSGLNGWGASVDTEWQRVSPITITATSSNPSKGTATYDEMFWRRIGDSMEIRITYEQTTAGTSGSGTYLFTVPDNKTINTSKIESASGDNFRGFCGSCITTDDTTYTHDGMALVYDSTHISLYIPNIGAVGSANDSLNSTKMRYYAFLTVPISTWSISGGTSGYSGFSGSNGNVGTSGFSGFSGITSSELYSKITNSTVIAITGAVSATLNRMHRISGLSGDYDITISGLSPADGDVLGFMVQDYSAANAQYRLDAGGTVQIAGRTRYLILLHTNVILLRWNGSWWEPLVSCLDTPWVTSGAITIDGVTSNPTKGTTSIDTLLWRRVGDTGSFRYRYRQTAAGSAGSGNYLFMVPIGTIADTKITTADAENVLVDAIFGDFRSYNGSSATERQALPYDDTRFRISSTSSSIGSSDTSLSNTTVRFSGIATFSMTDW